VSDRGAAASELEAYLRSGGRDRTRVADWQRRLGIAADGVAGRETVAALARELMRTPNAAGNVDQRRAAYELGLYYDVLRLRDNGAIELYQRRMGNISADHIIGPQTRARMAALLGS
jgi:peptidoglycan hydrolase-like protein with peptidoglycan-binding domain